MRAWNAVHDAIKGIQLRAREEFKFEVTDTAIASAVGALIEHRLSEMLSEQFNVLSNEELLIAREILRTDREVLDRAERDRVRGGKKKGDLN